jgi:hypothetical protein
MKHGELRIEVFESLGVVHGARIAKKRVRKDALRCVQHLINIGSATDQK